MEKTARDENLLKKHILKKIGKKRKYGEKDLKILLTSKKE
jgi:hypothetical protein